MRKNKITDDDYDIVDNGPEHFHHVRLGDSSPFPGVVYQYGEVQLIEEDESLRVKFKFQIFDNPADLKVEQSDSFVNYIGEILMINLEEFLIYKKYQKGMNV